MRLLRVLRQRARSLFRRSTVDAELRKELACHFEYLVAENIASGMSSAEARHAARRAMGSVPQLAEECRDQRRVAWLTGLQKDASFAWRMLRKSPGFTTLAIVTLALGVGSGIAVFALAESLLLRSLPYPSPERLVAIYNVHTRRGTSESVGQEDFRDWQSSNTVFERMAYTEFSQSTLTGLGEPERVSGRAVSEGFFEMLGVAPQLGRWFTPAEQKPGGGRVVLLSHSFWTRKLNARPDAVGSSIYLGDRAYTITGVMPAGFRFNEGRVAEYWTPISYRNTGRQNHQYAAYARLKRGVTLQSAQTQMSEIQRRLVATYPDEAGWGVRVAGLRGELLREIAPALSVAAVASIIVLLVACGNIASLLLARGIGRSKEIALRIALGAGRRRVVRLLLTESLLLSSLAAFAGIALAFFLVRVAVAASPDWVQLDALVKVSPSMAGFAVMLTIATGLLTGSWPAWRASRTSRTGLATDLKESGASLTAGRGQTRSLNVLVVMETALAVVLLSFAGLLARSFVTLLHTNLGYRADHLLTFRMPLPSRYRTVPARLQFWGRLLPQLAAIPGVVSADAADGIPLGGTYSASPVQIEGQETPRDWTDAVARGSSVTPGYFQTLGIPLLAGRTFNSSDTPDGEPVLIVNQAFVRKLLHGNALDQRVGGLTNHWARIVGVVGDSRYQGPAGGVEAEAYFPYTQDPYLQFVVLRTAIPEERVLNSVREVIRGLDRNLAITQLRTMQQSIDQSTVLQRQLMLLAGAFAAVALGLSTLGVAGVMAYAVSRRKREIGLRLALGARATWISRAVLSGAAKLVGAGAAIGVAASLSATRLLQSQLFGVRPHDPFVMVAAPLVLTAIALLACLWPSRQAARVQPMDALRED